MWRHKQQALAHFPTNWPKWHQSENIIKRKIKQEDPTPEDADKTTKTGFLFEGKLGVVSGGVRRLRMKATFWQSTYFGRPDTLDSLHKSDRRRLKLKVEI